MYHEPEETSHFAHELAAEMSNALDDDDRIARNNGVCGFLVRHVTERALLPQAEKRKLRWLLRPVCTLINVRAGTGSCRFKIISLFSAGCDRAPVGCASKT